MDPDTSTRLRLVEVRTPGGALRLGGGLACVLAAPAQRSLAARWIAAAVAGPRPDDVDGTVEIAGRFVSVRSLPSPLLPPSVPSALGREILRAQWRAACAARHDEIAAQHAARRLARHRAEAALERARQRVAELPDASAHARQVVVTPLADMAVAQQQAAEAAQSRAAIEAGRSRVEALLARLETLEPVPSAAALALADTWEAELAALPSEPAEDEVIDLAGAEARVNQARILVALASGGVDANVRAHVDELHREVVAAEAMVSESKRKERPTALARYEAAVRAEHEAMTSAGIESYASFLMGIAQGAVLPDAESRERAERALADAEAQLEEARAQESARARLAYGNDVPELRPLVAELLGYQPGDDVVAELRALRVLHPEVPSLFTQLRAELQAAGVPVEGDLEAAARAFVAAVSDEPIEIGEPLDAIDLVDDGASADDAATAHAELLALTRVRDEHDAELDAAERELARLNALRDVDLRDLDADAMMIAVARLLDGYRNGDFLAGRLPLVLDGVLDGLPAGPRLAAISTLATATDVQAVIVTDDAVLATDVQNTGAIALTWPEALEAPEAESALPVSPPERPVPASEPAPAPAPVVQRPRTIPPAAPRTDTRIDPAPPRPNIGPAPMASFGSAAPPRVAVSLASGGAATLLAPAVVPDLAPGPSAEPITRTACSLHHDTLSVSSCAHCLRPSCIECLVYVIGEPDLWCSVCAVEVHGDRPRSLRLFGRRGA